MLDLFKSYRISLILLVCIVPLQLKAFEYHDGLESIPRSCEHEWVSRYFNSLDDDTSIEEIIDFLISFKASLQAKGYQIPPLTEMCLQLRDELIAKGVAINDETIEQIYDEIARRENILIMPSSSFAISKNSSYKIIPAKKQNKGVGFSDGFAKGFMKAFGGALLCIIPHPVSWAIGGTLVATGINEMINHAGDSSDGGNDNIEDKIRDLPPPPDRCLPK